MDKEAEIKSMIGIANILKSYCKSYLEGPLECCSGCAFNIDPDSCPFCDEPASYDLDSVNEAYGFE